MDIKHVIQKEIKEEILFMLQDSFSKLCQLSQIDKLSEKSIFQLINSHYDNGLDYHNLSHIYSLLKIESQINNHIQAPIAFNWAIWFHDAIYNARRKNNEQMSAQLALQILAPHLNRATLDQINSLILSTAKHYPLNTEDMDHSIFLDADLSILAAEADIYKEYATCIAREYKHVPKFLYRYGRKKVLKQFLRRERIFYTDLFYKWGEERARRNITSELNGFKP